jgi:hypothetical protein
VVITSYSGVSFHNVEVGRLPFLGMLELHSAFGVLHLLSHWAFGFCGITVAPTGFFGLKIGHQVAFAAS